MKKKRAAKIEKQPPEILTFKADAHLVAALSRTPNRSEFIRTAVLKAFENSCPFCRGTGTTTINQRKHREEFLGKHRITECEECHELRIQYVKAGNRGRRAPCPSKSS